MRFPQLCEYLFYCMIQLLFIFYFVFKSYRRRPACSSSSEELVEPYGWPAIYVQLVWLSQVWGPWSTALSWWWLEWATRTPPRPTVYNGEELDDAPRRPAPRFCTFVKEATLIYVPTISGSQPRYFQGALGLHQSYLGCLLILPGLVMTSNRCHSTSLAYTLKVTI